MLSSMLPRSAISGRGLLQAMQEAAPKPPTCPPNRLTSQLSTWNHRVPACSRAPPYPLDALSFHPFLCDVLAAQLSLSTSCFPCVQERVTAFQHRAVWFALFGAMHISYAQLPSWQRPASPGSCWVLSLSLSLFVCLLVVRFLGCHFCWLFLFFFLLLSQIARLHESQTPLPDNGGLSIDKRFHSCT